MAAALVTTLLQCQLQLIYGSLVVVSVCVAEVATSYTGTGVVSVDVGSGSIASRAVCVVIIRTARRGI